MNETKQKPRLVYAHNGVDTFDPLFLSRLKTDFRVSLVTFRTPTKVTDRTSIVRLPDFGKQLRFRRLNNLRITLGTLWRMIRFRQCLNMLKPDMVIGNWVTTYGLYAMVSGWRPFILFAYGSDILVDPYRSPLHKALTMKVIRSADLVLIDSEIQRKAAIALGCLPENIISFPWVNLGDLKYITPDSGFRAKLNWQDKIVVVSVRKHEPSYAVDTLIRAIPMIVSQSPNTRFLIFGDGTQTARLVRNARETKVDGFVHFAGDVPRKDLLRSLCGCDIYVSTSLTDGCSSSLLEAMFLGLPVVVTSIPGNSEWVHDGVNGLMFHKSDHEGLARAVLSFVRNADERRSFAQRARTEVKRRINWKLDSAKLVERMLSLYDKYAQSSSAK